MLDRDKTLEPEPPRGIMRSLTTAVFGENSFKMNNNVLREKTRIRLLTEIQLTADYHQLAKNITIEIYSIKTDLMSLRETLLNMERTEIASIEDTGGGL